MNAIWIQKKIQLGNRAKFVLKGGDAVSGRLVEIGQDHIGVEVEDSQDPAVIPIEMVSYFQSLANEQTDSQVSKPQLTLRLPVESYVPDIDRKIEVQIAVENEGAGALLNHWR